jgi:hypothetical protein
MTPWVTALVLVVILAAFYIFLPNRRALRDDYVQRQTDEHEAMVAMLRVPTRAAPVGVVQGGGVMAAWTKDCGPDHVCPKCNKLRAAILQLLADVKHDLQETERKTRKANHVEGCDG